MTMKFTQLTTYWDARDASTVVEFIDLLRDLLWETYGDEITEMHQEASGNNLEDDESPDPEFDDNITF